jgi:hypothetical protein
MTFVPETLDKMAIVQASRKVSNPRNDELLKHAHSFIVSLCMARNAP